MGTYPGCTCGSSCILSSPTQHVCTQSGRARPVFGAPHLPQHSLHASATPDRIAERHLKLPAGQYPREPALAQSLPQVSLNSAAAGWPIPPGSEPWCRACPEGWATTTVDAGFCQMCTPGTFAASEQSPACSACPAGAYANTWGTTACKHCIMGTFSNSSVRPACRSGHKYLPLLKEEVVIEFCASINIISV